MREGVKAQGFTRMGNGLNSKSVNEPQKVEIAAARAHTACADLSSVLSEIALYANHTILPDFSHDALVSALTKREHVSSTSTPEGVAFPHAICDGVTPSASGIILLTLAQPILWGSNQVQIVVGLFGSPAEPWRHVRTLARIARACSQVHIRQQLIACDTDGALLNLFDKECNNHA